MRRWPVLLLVVALVLAGCGQFTGGPDTTPTAVPDQGNGGSDANGAGGPDGGDGPTATPTPQYSTALDTGNVLLTLSELPDGYDIEGETLRYRNRTSGETYNRMQERRVELLHERAFSTNATSAADDPELVFTSVGVYESPGAAQSWLDSHLDSIRESGGSVEESQVAGTAATVARFQSDGDLQTVAVYERRSNVVFYIAVSDEEYRDSSAEELFATVVDDFVSD